jgi:hypothetical protein
MPIDNVADLIEVSGYANIPKITMKFSGKMLSDDAVGLSDYDVMVDHGSLTYRAPKRAASVALVSAHTEIVSGSHGPINRRLDCLSLRRIGSSLEGLSLEFSVLLEEYFDFAFRVLQLIAAVVGECDAFFE